MDVKLKTIYNNYILINIFINSYISNNNTKIILYNMK